MSEDRFVCELCNWNTTEVKMICVKCGFTLHNHSHNSFYREINGTKEHYITYYPFLNKRIYNNYSFVHIKGKNHIKPKYHEL